MGDSLEATAVLLVTIFHLAPFLSFPLFFKELKRGGEDREDGGQPGGHGRPP